MLFQYQKFFILWMGLISGINVLGLAFSHDALLTWLPWYEYMTGKTALGFLMLSVALLLFRRQKHPHHIHAWIWVFGVVVLSGSSLLQDIFKLHLDWQIWVFTGQMSPLTALGFLFASFALLMLTLWHKVKYAQLLGLTAMLFLALMLIQGLMLHLFHPSPHSFWAHVASMSVMTALSFALLWLALQGMFQKRYADNSDVLYPGIALMYHLSYPQKFLLISLVMLLPLFVFMALKWQSLEDSIQHSELELAGIEHIQTTSQLSLAVAEHRGMSYAQFFNQHLFQNALIKKTMQVNTLLARNAIKDKADQVQIGIPPYWQDVLALWRDIQSQAMNAQTSWQKHSQMIALMNEHLRTVGRESLLSYDNDPWIHDLVAVELMVLPELMNTVGKIRGQGAAMFAKAGQQHDIDMHALEVQQQQVIFLLQKSDEILLHAWQGHTPALSRAYQKLRRDIQSLVDNMHQINVDKQGATARAEQFFQQVTDVIQEAKAFNLASMRDVQQQAEQRVQANLNQQYWIGFTALWVLLVVLYLLVAFYQSVMLTIHSLQDAAERMKSGTLDALSDVPTKDELGQVVTSFNSIGYELLQLSGRMHAVVEHAVDGIVTIQSSGEISHINAAGESIFGYRKDELIGRNVTCLMPESSRKKHQQGLAHYLATGEEHVFGVNLEVQGLRKNKEVFPLTISINEMQVKGDRMFVAMLRDITDYKQLEQQLRHAEKMEAIGELVGGVAHHFNNMLAAITGKAYLSKQHVKAKPEYAFKQLESIEQIVRQAAAMIQQLLVFSKKDFLKKKTNLSLNEVIHDAYQSSRLGIPEDVHVVLDLPDEDLMVYCDQEQLIEIIFHLFSNAFDAVAESKQKEVRLSLGLADLDERFYQRHDDLQEGMYACLSVSDTGHGMDELVQSRIFDPFYTTKEVGSGTGLGLSSVLGSVQSHGGVIEVDSEVGIGTRFQVYFPLVKTTSSRSQAKNTPSITASSQQGTLLIVDDEPMILEVRQEIFESLGFDVLLAEDGKQGLAMFEAHRHDILVVVTDMMMPKMNGVEMMHAIWKTSPTLPAVFITGYDQSHIKLSAEEHARSRVLSKPVNMDSLFEAVQTLLKG